MNRISHKIIFSFLLVVAVSFGALIFNASKFLHIRSETVVLFEQGKSYKELYADLNLKFTQYYNDIESLAYTVEINNFREHYQSQKNLELKLTELLKTQSESSNAEFVQLSNVLILQLKKASEYQDRISDFITNLSRENAQQIYQDNVSALKKQTFKDLGAMQVLTNNIIDSKIRGLLALLDRIQYTMYGAIILLLLVLAGAGVYLWMETINPINVLRDFFLEFEDKVHIYDLPLYKIAERIRHVRTDSLRNSYLFGDKSIFIMDSLGIYPTQNQVDYLILTQSPKINLERLLDSIQPKTILADGSNYKSYVERWKKTALKRKLPFHYTNEKGAYAFDVISKE